jgi:hypothetical protein
MRHLPAPSLRAEVVAMARSRLQRRSRFLFSSATAGFREDFGKIS